MPHATDESTPEATRDMTRSVFAAEQERIRHYRKALECVSDDGLRRHWHRELKVSRDRAARMAIALSEMGEPMPVAQRHPSIPGCLLDAMDMALCNGDISAAETVARECVTLIDLRCNYAQSEYAQSEPRQG